MAAKSNSRPSRSRYPAGSSDSPPQPRRAALMPIPKARIDAALAAATEFEPKLQLVLMETRLLLRTLDSQREELRLLCRAAQNSVRHGRADDAHGILNKALALLD